MKLSPPRFAQRLLDKDFPAISQKRVGLLLGLAGAAALGAVAALVISGGGGQGNKSKGGAETNSATPAAPGASALTVQTLRPAQRTMSQRLGASGAIQPWREAIIGAEIPGIAMARIVAEVGQQVKKGDLLAEYESASVRAERDQAAAAVREATAQAAEARANLERQKSLREQGMVSAQALLAAETAVSTVEARAESARARLRSADIRLAQTRITAPDDGLISSRTAALGAVASVGQELFRLIVKGRLEWRADLTAEELSRVQPGMSVDIALPPGAAEPASLVGTVRAVSPAVASGSRTGPVLVDLPPHPSLRAGGFLRGEIRITQTPMLAVPATALVLRDGFEMVLIAEPAEPAESGFARIRSVKVKVLARDGDFVGIAGLDSEGEGAATISVDNNIVARGGAFLADGDRVTIAPATAQ